MFPSSVEVCTPKLRVPLLKLPPPVSSTCTVGDEASLSITTTDVNAVDVSRYRGSFQEDSFGA